MRPPPSRPGPPQPLQPYPPSGAAGPPKPQQPGSSDHFFSGVRLDMITVESLAELDEADRNLRTIARVAWGIRNDSLLVPFIVENDDEVKGAFEPVYRLVRDLENLYRFYREYLYNNARERVERNNHAIERAQMDNRAPPPRDNHARRLRDALRAMRDRDPAKFPDRTDAQTAEAERERLRAVLDVQSGRHQNLCPLTVLLQTVSDLLSRARITRPPQTEDWEGLEILQRLFVSIVYGERNDGPTQGTSAPRASRSMTAAQRRNDRSRKIQQDDLTAGQKVEGPRPIPPLATVPVQGQSDVTPGIAGCILFHYNRTYKEWIVTSATPQWGVFKNLKNLGKAVRDMAILELIAKMPENAREEVRLFDAWSKTVHDKFDKDQNFTRNYDPLYKLNDEQLRRLDGIMATFRPDAMPQRCCLTDWNRLLVPFAPKFAKEPAGAKAYPPYACAEYHFFIVNLFNQLKRVVKSRSPSPEPEFDNRVGRSPGKGKERAYEGGGGPSGGGGRKPKAFTPSPPRPQPGYYPEDLQGGQSFSGYDSARITGEGPVSRRLDRPGPSGRDMTGSGYASGQGFGRDPVERLADRFNRTGFY
ncbi:hypothetical protein B0H66DRAFT_606859 [Apodospora peruviana]|uniref:Uncharacterized protein n=1 Tax=Apodospora peruviana TaxID=516989 RepID=A0AAE0HW02_9PEZI|nr:hypothetical protein B0H66DRAFT_606859 [Apodospora peruviana]